MHTFWFYIIMLPSHSIKIVTALSLRFERSELSGDFGGFHEGEGDDDGGGGGGGGDDDGFEDDGFDDYGFGDDYDGGSDGDGESFDGLTFGEAGDNVGQPSHASAMKLLETESFNGVGEKGCVRTLLLFFFFFSLSAPYPLHLNRFPVFFLRPFIPYVHGHRIAYARTRASLLTKAHANIFRAQRTLHLRLSPAQK